MGKRFGDQQYAAEELVAELGAVMIAAELGIAAVPRTRAVPEASEERPQSDLHCSSESRAGGRLPQSVLETERQLTGRRRVPNAALSHDLSEMAGYDQADLRKSKMCFSVGAERLPDETP